MILLHNTIAQVTKAYSMLSSCLSGLKLELPHFQSIWKKYSDIWNIEREVVRQNHDGRAARMTYHTYLYSCFTLLV